MQKQPNFAALAAPFDPSKVSWRVGSTTGDKKRGMALAYIDSRDVMQRLDAVCGPDGWQCEYPHAGTKTVCSIGIKVDAEWVWKADGAGDTDFEADKGALSDAFKRAAVKWGIGRYLYDIDAPWVAVVPQGKSFAIDKSELEKLQKLLPGSVVRTAEAPKSPPGITAAKTASAEAIRLMASCDDDDSLSALIQSDNFKRTLTDIYLKFPSEWTGVDGPNQGLRGQIEANGKRLGCEGMVQSYLVRAEKALRQKEAE
jgi:hypothetical protein